MQQIRCLTSLRFFAAMAIVFNHVRDVTGVPLEWMNHVVLQQGVSLFFILSGFILSVVYDKSDLYRNKSSFYRARIARIYPLYLLGIGVGLWMLWPQLAFIDTGYLVFSIAMEMLALQAWFPSLDAWLPSSLLPINGVGWSISAEAFFYAVFPFVKRSRRSMLVLSLLSVSATGFICAFGSRLGVRPGYQIGTFLRILDFDPLIRAIEFLYGVWLGDRFARRPCSPASIARQSVLVWSLAEFAAIALCLASSAICFRTWADPATDIIWGGAWKTLVLIFGASPFLGVLVWVMAHERGIVSQILRWQPLVLLGAASYALYLLHERVFVALVQAARLPPPGTPPSPQFLLLDIGFFTTLLALALLCHLCVEEPLRRWLRPSAGRAMFPWASLAPRHPAPQAAASTARPEATKAGSGS